MQGWQQLDQATLDDAYANAPYITGADAYVTRWAEEAAAFRRDAKARLDIPYADHPGARLDLFLPDGETRGLIVFVHGGYWRRFGKSDWSHFAQGGLMAGRAVAMVGYPLAPAVRIHEITALTRQAVDVAADLVGGPICLTGHSAGGHLVARMVMADAAPTCVDRIATCVPISPVADLRPLVPQGLNTDWRLTEAEAEAESPVTGHPVDGPVVTVHVGAEERPSFLWQAEALSTAWGSELRITSGRHHFDVIDDLHDPSSTLMTDILGV